MATATYPSWTYSPSHNPSFGTYNGSTPSSPWWDTSGQPRPAVTPQSNNPYAQFMPRYEMSGALCDPPTPDAVGMHGTRFGGTSTPRSYWQPTTESSAQTWPPSGHSTSHRPAASIYSGRRTTITAQDFLPPSQDFALTARDLEEICAGDTQLTAAERTQLTAIAQERASHRRQANAWTAADWLDKRQSQRGWTNRVRNALSTVGKSYLDSQRDVDNVARDFDTWYDAKLTAASRSTHGSFVPRVARKGSTRGSSDHGTFWGGYGSRYM